MTPETPAYKSALDANGVKDEVVNDVEPPLLPLLITLLSVKSCTPENSLAAPKMLVSHVTVSDPVDEAMPARNFTLETALPAPAPLIELKDRVSEVERVSVHKGMPYPAPLVKTGTMIKFPAVTFPVNTPLVFESFT